MELPCGGQGYSHSWPVRDKNQKNIITPPTEQNNIIIKTLVKKENLKYNSSKFCKNKCNHQFMWLTYYLTLNGNSCKPKLNILFYTLIIDEKNNRKKSKHICIAPIHDMYRQRDDEGNKKKDRINSIAQSLLFCYFLV